MSQKKSTEGWMKKYSENTGCNASIQFSEELLSVEVSGTPDMYRYYETGKLPENEAERELYQLMIEKGEI